jgi:hypothetical protein
MQARCCVHGNDILGSMTSAKLSLSGRIQGLKRLCSMVLVNIVTVRFFYPGYAVTSIISDYEYELLSHIIFHLVES